MSCYNHLTTEERESILVYLAQGLSKRKIAQALHRSPSTICRELKRNKDNQALQRYSPNVAEKKYRNRRKRCHRHLRLKEKETYALVVSLLWRRWSPEQINQRLKLEGNPIQIGASTIYRGKKRKLLPKELRICFRTRPYHKPGKHKRTGQFEMRHFIAERPEEANRRSRIGDWESDTVHGTRGSGCLATHADRKSRYEVAILLRDSTSEAYMKATVEAMRHLPTLTFTTDRGKEFARNEILTEELKAEVYFADPHVPGQRGTNENTNGLMRQFFPKRKSFENLTQEQVDHVVDLLNHRPRKCLGWRCRHEVFFNEVLHLT